MIKKIGAVICIVSAVFLGYLLWNEKQIEKQQAELANAMSIETLPYSTQINDLRLQIKNLEKEAEAVENGKATTQFMINDLSESSYEQVMIPMLNYGYPVGLAVSLNEMPGEEGYMTVDQATDLIDQGWYFCYAYDSEEINELIDSGTCTDEIDALAYWLSAVKEKAQNYGFEINNVILFPTGTYQDSFIDVLKQNAIQVIIHHGETGNGILTAEESDDLWYAGYAWWRGNSILASKLSTIISSGGELVIVMGIDGSATTSLETWMNDFNGTIDGENIEVTDFSRMIEIQTENDQISDEVSVPQQEKINELTLQIAELQSQIDEIEQGYRENMRSLEE